MRRLDAAMLAVTKEAAEALAAAETFRGRVPSDISSRRRKKLADYGLIEADFQTRGIWRVTTRGEDLLKDLRRRGLFRSDYEGRTLRGVVRRTLVRGREVFSDGAPAPTPGGRILQGPAA